MTESTANPYRGNRRRRRGQAGGRASRGKCDEFLNPIVSGKVANCRLQGQTVSSSTTDSPPTGIFTSMWASPAPAPSSQSKAASSAAAVAAALSDPTPRTQGEAALSAAPMVFASNDTAPSSQSEVTPSAAPVIVDSKDASLNLVAFSGLSKSRWAPTSVGTEKPDNSEPTASATTPDHGSLQPVTLKLEVSVQRRG